MSQDYGAGEQVNGMCGLLYHRNDIWVVRRSSNLGSNAGGDAMSDAYTDFSGFSRGYRKCKAEVLALLDTIPAYIEELDKMNDLMLAVSSIGKLSGDIEKRTRETLWDDWGLALSSLRDFLGKKVATLGDNADLDINEMTDEEFSENIKGVKL